MNDTSPLAPSGPFGAKAATWQGAQDDFGDAVEVTEIDADGFALCVAADTSKDVLAALSAVLGIPLPSAPGQIAAAHGRAAFWFSPNTWLVRVDGKDEGELVDAVGTAFADGTVLAARYGDALCWFEITGSGAEALLRQGGFLSLDPDGFKVGLVKRTSLAGVNVVVYRPDTTAWRLGIERSRARYFMDWLGAAKRGQPIVEEN